MKIVETHMGKIYSEFDFPKSIKGLDLEILKRTLDYFDFCAAMSDNYSTTLSEQAGIARYRKEHNL